MLEVIKTVNLFYQQAKVWLHITLTYMFINAIFATLICAYLQEANQIVISLFLITGCLYGLFKAEKIRKTTGLSNYQIKLKAQ